MKKEVLRKHILKFKHTFKAPSLLACKELWLFLSNKLLQDLICKLPLLAALDFAGCSFTLWGFHILLNFVNGH